MLLAVAAWLVSGACVGLSLWHVRRLSRLRAPAPDAEESEDDLRERFREAERALSLATLVPRSLARISLASGTAIAVSSLASGLGSPNAPLPGGLVEFAAGLTGMVGCTLFGQQAKIHAAALRDGWRRVRKVAARK